MEIMAKIALANNQVTATHRQHRTKTRREAKARANNAVRVDQLIDRQIANNLILHVVLAHAESATHHPLAIVAPNLGPGSQPLQSCFAVTRDQAWIRFMQTSITTLQLVWTPAWW